MRRIVHLRRGGEERFLIWSSVVDAPVGVKNAQQIVELLRRDGRKDNEISKILADARVDGLWPMFPGEERLTRAQRILSCNRAGPGESEVKSLKRLWELYCEERSK